MFVMLQVPLLDHGAGRQGSLVTPITIKQAISQVKAHLGLPHLRVALANTSTLCEFTTSYWWPYL